MFVEKLTKDDIVNYIANYEIVKYDESVKRQYDFNLISNYKVTAGKITFSIRNINFEITDFDFETNYTIKLKGVHNKNWLNFMYEKFGDAYKKAFLAYRSQEKKKLLEETAKNFDDDTADYEGGLEA